MVDIAGIALSEADRYRLMHPLVGGVILFTRNYETPEQLAELTGAISRLRNQPLLIAVDHEGGRVQRFKNGFTELPAMADLGEWWDRSPQGAVQAARALGFVTATELRARGVHLTFAPVLDLDWGRSGVIGNRSFHHDPEAVIALAGAFTAGLHLAGMACCGKHFPGHGWVEADSHIAIPVDERPLDDLEADLRPYRVLQLDAVMPAHVIYPSVDRRPAGFSPVWLNMLRQNFTHTGVIFSDDLSMAGASVAGDIVDRADAAWGAGCDMLIVCNAPESVDRLLKEWKPQTQADRGERIARLLPRQTAFEWQALAAQPLYQAGLSAAERLNSLRA